MVLQIVGCSRTSVNCGVVSDILTSFLRSRCAVEHRGQKYHRGRLSQAIREEIETILEGELGDPRIGLASVSSVLMATTRGRLA